MEVRPECQDGEMGRDIRKLNRGKRPKLTTLEIAKLLNCDRPADEEERGEMSGERQWGALESMGLLKKDPAKEDGEEKATTTVTTSPKPPPPKEPATFAVGPISQSRLGGQDAKGKAHKGKDCKGDPKWGDSTGDSKRKILQMR